jgi:HD-GYP domain-containing protein (c-di-GMP phosphodiesterase class II)
VVLLSRINLKPAHGRKLRSPVLAALRDAFDAEFTVYADVDDETICAELASGAGRMDDSRAGAWANKRGREPERQQDPRTIELSGGRLLLIVPLRPARRRLTAAAVVDGHAPELAVRLAAAVARNARLRRRLHRRRFELDAYADRVSRDFEELTWLRKLAEGIELCDVTSGPEAVAASLLPSLCGIIEAESLALIRAEDCDVPDQNSAPGGTPPSCWAASRRLPDKVYRRIVQRFADDARGGPVVKNGLPRGADTDAGPIDSFILVPIAKGEWRFGWLLAVNKTTGEPGYVGGHTAGLSKPEFGSFETGLLVAAAVMLSSHARNTDLFRQRELLLIGVIRALVNAIDAKDAYTCGHSDRVARIAMRLAEELGLDHQNCLEIYMTGLLHDVGKIGVPDAILCKPGKLTDEEFAVVKRHPSIGYQILKHVRQLSYVLPGVLHHHEAMTGSGYPFGLAGESIPFAARILAVADSYDAMTSSRPYREAMPFEKAETIIRDDTGGQWDAEVVAALFRALADIHEICVDSRSRDLALQDLAGDGQTLSANTFARR